MDVLQDARHRPHRRGLSDQSRGRALCGSRAADQPRSGRLHSVFPIGTSAYTAGSAQAAAGVQAAAAGPHCYAATAYLRKRCIHPNVLSFCKQKKILYQTSIKNHPNCVFVGRDGEGQAKGGSLRGCGAQQFRRDIPGSRKIYPFYIEAAAETDTVEVYEAPIDAMSGASLRILQHDGNWHSVHYLALGGTGYAALDAYLTYFPNIQRVVLCLDNDEAGRTRTQEITKHLAGSGKTVQDRAPPLGKDYNDTLVQFTQEFRQRCMTLDDILEESR